MDRETDRFYSKVGSSGFYHRLSQLSGHAEGAHRFIEQVPLARNGKWNILDVGCGTGVFTDAAVAAFPHARIVAVDRNGPMLDCLRQRLPGMDHAVDRVEIMQEDIGGTIARFREEFHLIITGGFLEYVDTEDMIRMLAQALVPGGYFLNVPLRRNPAGWLIAWICRCKPRSREEFVQAFAKAGLTLEQVSRLGFWRYFPTSLLKEGQLYRKETAGKYSKSGHVHPVQVA